MFCRTLCCLVHGEGISKRFLVRFILGPTERPDYETTPASQRENTESRFRIGKTELPWPLDHVVYFWLL